MGTYQGKLFINLPNDGVLVVNQSGQVLDINPAARSILGLPAREQPDPSWGQTLS